ncbi:hypothetical protein GCM10022421_06370 [Oceanisphaera sediminis]|uniref:Uncharacterized protein n=1 Tax=Oceanisphaera sediminis TaxID=981381 RepID=A0ABP7DBT0_9GAMM
MPVPSMDPCLRRGDAILVIPAKAGIQGRLHFARTQACTADPMDPRLREGDDRNGLRVTQELS